jgi:hypothetical protein
MLGTIVSIAAGLLACTALVALWVWTRRSERDIAYDKQDRRKNEVAKSTLGRMISLSRSGAAGNYSGTENE